MKSLNEFKEELKMNEGVLAIAGGIVLGGLGLIAAIKGISAVKNWAGEKAWEIADRRDAKQYAERVAKQRKDRDEFLKPIVDKFIDDDKLKSMYASLPEYSSLTNKKAIAGNKERTKQMNNIAKYIKTFLTPAELSYFTDISAKLRQENKI
tara:strand:- start:27 stop:479 length:453 start_codon:yes stop_codon:yes gene_type:complete